MKIYADIRILIVAGLVLFLAQTGRNYPLPLQRKTYSPGKQLIMTRKPCQDTIGNVGVCMFKYDCIRQKGLTLSTCVDGFLFGACCFLKEGSSPKITDIPFQIEKDFIYQKENNIIFDEILHNTDIFNLTKYSTNEKGVSSTAVFSTHGNVSTITSVHTTTTPFPNTTIEEETSIWLFKNVSHTSLNLTSNDNDDDTEEDSHQILNISKPNIINNVKYTTKVHEITIADNLTFSDTTVNNYETKIYTSTEPSTYVNYKNAALVADDKFKSTENWQTTKFLTGNTVEENSPNEAVSQFSYNYPSTISNSQSTIDSKVFPTTSIEEKSSNIVENAAISSTIPYDVLHNSEMLDTNLTTFTKHTDQRKTITNPYEVSNDNHSPTLLETVGDVTKILYSTSENYTTQATTIARNDEKVTSKHVSTIIEEPDKNSFTIYDQKFTNNHKESTSNNKESTISIFTKENILSNQSLSSLDGDTRITTQTLPIVSEWSSQHSLPAGFQYLVAQLSAGEITSPTTTNLNSDAQTLQPIDTSVIREPDLPLEEIEGTTEHVGDSSSEIFYDDNNHSIGSSTSNFKGTTLNMYDRQTEVSSNDYNETNTLFANSYVTNILTDDTFAQTVKGDSHSNFETTVPYYVHSSTITNTESQTDLSEIHNNSQNTPLGAQSENATVFEEKDIESFSNIPNHSEEQAQFYGEYTSLLPIYSSELKNLSSHVTPIFDITEENVLLNTTKNDLNEWLETVIYNQTPKVPEIINNHANKFTPDLDNNVDKIDLSLVNTTYLIENNTSTSIVNTTFLSSVNQENFTTTAYTSTSSSKLESNDMTSSMGQGDIISGSTIDGSNAGIHYLITSAYVTESGASQSYINESTQLLTNQPTINEPLTISNSASPYDDLHELENNVNILEMDSNDSGFQNITDKNNLLNEMQENLVTVTPTSQFNFTVFKDYLDNMYENTSSVSISFSANIEPDQFQETNTSGSQVSDLNFESNHDKENDGTVSYVTTLTDFTSEIILHAGLPNDTVLLEDFENSTEITSTFHVNEKEGSSTSYTEIMPNLQTVTFVTNLTVSGFEEMVENSTFPLDQTSVQIPTTTSSQPSTNISTDGLTNMHPADNSTQTYDITFASQNSSPLSSETEAYSSKPIEVSEVSSTLPSSTSNTKWDYKRDCGVRLMQPIGRIVGGKNTYFGKWPWQALVKEATWLGLFLKNKCGGVLITAKYVLTAAHCQPGFFASLLVVLGTHDLAETFDSKVSVIRNVKRMVVHRHYNAQTFENDLALLEMESRVEFSPYVVPICLPYRKEDFTNKMAFVTGWGKLTHGGDVPNILQEVQVPIVANGDCQRMFFHAGHQKAIRSNFVCAGYTNGGQDSCEGDSGGPLMVQREDNRWVLVGTVSHGIGCADPNLPGVYMRMSSYRPWIDSIINKNP